MKNQKKQEQTEWLFRWFGLAGIVIWSVTILLRSALSHRPLLLDFCMGVAPNFGVVFVLAYWGVFCWHRFLKKEFNPAWTPLMTAGILVILLASEIVHFLFLGAGFDWWDMAASLVASAILIIGIKVFSSPR